MKQNKWQNNINRSREQMANERTFLAWIRTSIALMGFGFVIVKFSLFLTELSLMLEFNDPDTNKFPSFAGVLMVAIGVVTALFAFIKFRQIGRASCRERV